MVDRNTLVQLEYKGNVESLCSDIQQVLSRKDKPDLVYVNLSSAWFPMRMIELPNRLKMLFASNPSVKPLWDSDDEVLECLHISKANDLSNEDTQPTVGVSMNFPDNAKYAKSINYVPKVVVAMTSWKKRIQNCVYVINCLLNNTRKPDIVFLSLSTEEFPNLCGDLPEDLMKLCMTNQQVKLNWVSGPNTKSMKKVYPILPFLEDDDMIILCDDDFDIPQNFIQARVDEFTKHRCMFPISGGTNPKWHLNLPLYHTRYNTIAATSIFTKKMLNGYSSVWSKSVIETYKDDTIHTLLCLSNGYYPIPSKVISTYCGVTEQKIPLYNEVDGMKNNRIWKSDKETIATFVKEYNKNMDHTYRQSLFNLVLFDSFDVAGDNAETFYRMAREQYPWLNMTFLISRDSSDWDRLERDGFRLYPIDGDDVDVIMQNASYILWSKDTSLFKHLYKNKAKSIFLSHGRTSLMYDCSEYYKNRLSKCTSYVSCTSDEEASVVEKYTNGKVTPIVTGFPRHDLVLHKSKMRDEQMTEGSKKQVLISFHYRPWELYNTDRSFLNSDYLSGVNKFLNSRELKKLST